MDIGREHGCRAGLVACDVALQLGATRSGLRAALADMTNWPHVTRAQAAVDDADPGAESVGETLTRTLVREMDRGPVETQFSVEVGGAVSWVDLRVGRHLVEFDGRKYVGRAGGGVADKSPGDVGWDEKAPAEELICGRGFGMSRVVWSDLWGAQRHRTLDRLQREYDVTTRRFGTRLPEGYRRFPRRRPRVK